MTDNERRPRPEFGSDLTPPADYDPFETRRRVPRADESGPVEPLLIPRNVDRPIVDGPPPKVPFWDRPKPAKDWYWFLGRLGGALITLGLLMFLFVGYQLWGTGIEEAQSQNRLEDQFTQLAVTTTTAPSTTAPTTPTPDSTIPQTTTTVAPPRPVVVSEGDPIAIIDMPAIGVSKYVVAGVETADLKKGPGHFSSTPFPGELGNAAIAGHRTTYGEPFRRLDDLEIGDEIRITDLLGRVFVYRVTEQKIVAPSDSWVVATDDYTRATLTLTTCHPEYSAKQRLIVTAQLDLSVSSPATSPAAVYAGSSDTTSDTTSTTSTTTTPPTTAASSDSTTTTSATTSPATTQPPTTLADPFDSNEPSSASTTDGFEDGWFSDAAAWPQFLLWTALELLIVWGAWQVAKKFRNRIIGAAVGFIPFFVVLYFVFQNVNRLLPPNL